MGKKQNKQAQRQLQDAFSLFVDSQEQKKKARQICIWDFDWYYAKDKSEVQQNADARLISSYHKQLGDSVVFVATEADINRDGYDII